MLAVSEAIPTSEAAAQVAAEEDSGPAAPRDGAGARRLSLGAVIEAALGTYRRRFWQVVVAALLIMVPVDAALSIIEAAADLPRGDSAVAAGARIAIVVADAAAATIGTTFFAGVLDRVVAVDRHGLEDVPLTRALREVPLVRLVLADLAAVGLIVLGAVAFVVPGVVLAVLLAIVGPVLVIEDLGVWPALRRSAQLVRPHALLTFLLVLLPSGLEESLVSWGEHATHGNTLLWLVVDVATTAVVGSFVGILEITLAHDLIADHAAVTARRAAAKG